MTNGWYPKKQLRRSQFVLMYGPGSIIETSYGPKMIPSFEIGIPSITTELESLEIADRRLRAAIGPIAGNEVRVFEVPSDEMSVGRRGARACRTTTFPTWNICYGRGGDHPVLFNALSNSSCPICGNARDPSPVRFVLACEDGHLDDLDWHTAVHGNASRCNPRYYMWRTAGSSFSDITLECPSCGAQTSIAEIYRINFDCTGRFPEREIRNQGQPYSNPRRPYRCTKRMALFWRQSSSLRLAETVTLLTLPDYDTPIDRLLTDQGKKGQISAAITFVKVDDDAQRKSKLLENLRTIIGGRGASIETKDIEVVSNFLEGNSYDSFVEKVEFGLNTIDSQELLRQEYDALSNGPWSHEKLSMGVPISYSFGDPGVELEVSPIDKLVTVTAQTGYKRMVRSRGGSSLPSRVDISVTDSSNRRWIPGFQGQGEGLFVNLVNDLNDIDPAARRAWESDPYEYDRSFYKLWADELTNPTFVWLHSLSHALIAEIAYQSGYSSASIRERVYLDRSGRKGGVLLYTSSPGQDGSMGGLVGLVDDFQAVLNAAYERISFCSNDPLCQEDGKNDSKRNGSACHSCLFASETSCEYRNVSLDRHVVKKG